MQGPRRVHPRGRASQSGRTISDADRGLLNKLLGESGRTISDADRGRINASLGNYIRRNDGGIARKTRNF
jgi:hypothetical protein